MKKRGQITVFIVIGLLILFTFYLLSREKRESIEDTEIIQPELIPVQQFVESCSKELAKEALFLIGANGGYIYFPEWIDRVPGRSLQNSPNRDIRNPLWWFDGTLAIPPLAQIEQDMARFIQDRMPRCLNNFSAFNRTYAIEELGDLKTAVILGDDQRLKDDVTVRTQYPIKVKDRFNTTLAELQKFVITLPIRFQRTYNLAKLIMEREKKDFFIEEKAIDLINMDPKTPTTGFEFTCKKKIWQTAQVEDRIKKLLEVNLNHLKVKGTKFDPDAILPYLGDTVPDFRGKLTAQQIKEASQAGSPSATRDNEKDFSYLNKALSDTYKDSYYYAHYVWDLARDPEPYRNFRTNFQFDRSWPFLLKASPSKGPIMETNAMKGSKFLSAFCLHTWHFTYSMEFPVKVTLVDEKAEKNDGYTFSFAFQAKLTKNYPDPTAQDFTTMLRRDIYTSDEYCADITAENPVMVLIARDLITDEDISKVNMTFTCGRYACDIGQTKPDFTNRGAPSLKKQLPQCTNGILRGSKANYEDAQRFINTEIERIYTLPMQPVKYFNISVRKHMLKDIGDSGSGIDFAGERLLGNGEEALVMVRYPPKKFESFAIYDRFPVSLDDPIQSSLKLLAKEDIEYEVEVYLSSNKTITGGYIANWTASKDQIKLGENITFHIAEQPHKVGEEFKESDDIAILFFGALPAISEKLPPPEIK
ncbi:hypothetical protein HYU14_00895 [Candidatus Woesearchaeota archaeon]|nr:hypothetical protein [Candidatus Woesearchaeota archaeon]